MEINIIKTEKEYKEALKELDNLLYAKENSSKAEKLEILSILVEDYENKHYKIEAPDPIEAINFRIEQLGLSRKDLEKSIGSRSKVSEILNKRRPLTLSMIRKLHKNLNIPADILIQEIHTKRA
ncbi:helix-turn-helix protein [Rickettsia monacensis]|uniref:Helix-turn-helix protein n=1 Tax=Rickettsia monacensis TaxID=109232 RepID=A0A0B7J2P2_9RICK|nr:MULTISPECIES: helix-turn-helix domain-containing protein [Rickettsia]KJW02268.1 helix-turn-helix family protein [Rickettsia endosymbiont of Ixodes pacificus]CDI28882.1 putative transcription regulator containing HTH domain protein [Rickettsia monacensis IrR/Munich]CEO16648.1 helix-turn-helix protein [Rickettsia monacensis]